MVVYYCDKDHIEVKTSVCPHCMDRTRPVQSKIFWCKHCQIPLYKEECTICGSLGKQIGSDIRPVFPEERILLESILYCQEGKEVSFVGKAVWNVSGNRYFVNGEKIKLIIGKLKELDTMQIWETYSKKIEKLERYKKDFSIEAEKFVLANQERYQQIDKEALDYIKEFANQYFTEDMMISFSGGKDSTVVADLVTRALDTGNQKILHIFGDTTLEFPKTYEYVERYKKAHPKTLVLSSRNKEKDFQKLCMEIGPPSRVMRWCCTIFKTGAITRKIEKVFRDKTHIITFYGIRRSESASRSKYEKETESPKIAKQTVVAPIIDWYDFDVWLYILARGIDFNDAYRLGYTRVGCWCCPNNSDWSEFLSKVYMPQFYNSFRTMLVDFARKIGKPDAEVYVDSGKWKARQGGNGVSAAQKSIVAFTPCAAEENTFHYALQRPISEELYELFKPFGKLDFNMGNKRLGEVYIIGKKGNMLLRLQGRIGNQELKVTVLDVAAGGLRKLLGAKEKIESQITKYQMCMGCLACEGICKVNAIQIREIDNRVTYHIDEKKCVHCGQCIGHFIGGCYMRKVLAIKRG
ncbi:MAG: phosphoadenosine phosphosulfate reductase family protein [Lachnospiraceae bacterium]|nr:phosphoadenosine phosphosulfate reductase family protein [Lachnospiraceae bacterium]